MYKHIHTEFNVPEDFTMPKIKILAVAPYDGMADAISAIAMTRDDIQMTVQTGDLDTGRKIALELAHNNYDVIISRGGTAELIRSTVELPVIDIPISVYDVLRTIKLAESYSGKFVIAGFPSITNCSKLLCDLLQYDIDIITFTNETDAMPSLKRAMENGCTLALCDMIGFKASSELGMNSLLISSGNESITSAIDDAVKLVKSAKHVHKQKDLFQKLLSDNENEFLIYNPAGSLWFSSIAQDNRNTSLMNLVQTYLKAFLKVPDQTVQRQIRDKIYTLTNRHLFYDDLRYTAIIITQRDAVFSEDQTEIIIYNRLDEQSHDFTGEYSSSQHTGNTAHLIKEYSKNNYPVLILGEPGTGKDKIAKQLYENGQYSSSPLYIINCELIGERKWNAILNNADSPLTEINTTIYIKNMNALSKNKLNDFFAYIDNSKLATRNRLIFSLALSSENSASIELCRNYLENKLCCLTLSLPPLRERMGDLPSIAALYIHRINVSTGKQIIGFESEAMELMTEFTWPNNLDQLHHVIKELVVSTKTPYITYNDVKAALEAEPNPDAGSNNDCSFDLSGTLDDINYRIIKQVLNEEGQNKEKTAKRLGISRSTLWRMLKNQV